MPRKGQKKTWPFIETSDPRGLVVMMKAFVEAMAVRGYSEGARHAAEFSVSSLIVFCHERAVTKVEEVTRPLLERYQRHLYLHRKVNGAPLSIVFQHGQLTYIRQFFKWMSKGNYILSNPASDLELPRLPFKLPREVLTVEEAERVLGVPDIQTPVGLRDRVLLETFYATGMRRKEVSFLKLYDVDFSRETILIREGKGKKDRVVPLSERLNAWLTKYLTEVRPGLVQEPDERFVFCSAQGGGRLNTDVLSAMVREYVEASGIGKKGSCHLFRHTAATLMLEGGADIRYVQEMLGHAELGTTQIYTRVTITKLKEVYETAHPGAKLRKGAKPEE